MFKSKKNPDTGEEENGNTVNPQPENDGWTSLFNLPDRVEKDNIVLDLVSAIEQLIRARQISENSLKELQKRHQHAQEQIESLQKEIAQVRTALENKEGQVKEWEGKFADKNMAIDQLMEDYNILQANVTKEIRELKNAYEIERGKNKQVQEQNLKESIENITILKKNEETIVMLRTENENLKKSYENIRKENTYILSMVNDFTSRMSLSFSQYNQENLNEFCSDGEV